MSDKGPRTSIDRIAEELASWAGSGVLIIDHMTRRPGTASSEVDAIETFRTLVRDTVAPIGDRHAPHELAAAADVLADAVEILRSKILLVDPSVREDEP